jgi:hypothetical protein
MSMYSLTKFAQIYSRHPGIPADFSGECGRICGIQAGNSEQRRCTRNQTAATASFVSASVQERRRGWNLNCRQQSVSLIDFGGEMRQPQRR